MNSETFTTEEEWRRFLSTKIGRMIARRLGLYQRAISMGIAARKETVIPEGLMFSAESIAASEEHETYITEPNPPRHPVQINSGREMALNDEMPGILAGLAEFLAFPKPIDGESLDDYVNRALAPCAQESNAGAIGMKFMPNEYGGLSIGLGGNRELAFDEMASGIIAEHFGAWWQKFRIESGAAANDQRDPGLRWSDVTVSQEYRKDGNAFVSIRDSNGGPGVSFTIGPIMARRLYDGLAEYLDLDSTVGDAQSGGDSEIVTHKNPEWANGLTFAERDEIERQMAETNASPEYLIGLMRMASAIDRKAVFDLVRDIDTRLSSLERAIGMTGKES